MKTFTIRSMMLWTALFAFGLGTGLHFASGPAWVTYYQAGYQDGFKSGAMPIQRMQKEIDELYAERSERMASRPIASR